MIHLNEYIPIYSKAGFINLDYSFQLGGPSHNQLFLVDDILLKIDQNLKVELNNNFSRANYANALPTFIFINDHIYFLCSNDESGFQVYSYYTGPSSLIEQNEEKSNLGIFPNPSQDYITIKSHDQKMRDFDFTMYDMQGRMVDSGRSDGQIIKVDKLEQGAYILNIFTKEGVLHGKFIKM